MVSLALDQQQEQDEFDEKKWRAELDQKIVKAATDTSRVTNDESIIYTDGAGFK